MVFLRRCLVAILFVLLTVSCSNKHIASILDEADALMLKQPEKSLELLEAIDSSSLNSRDLQARFFLLYSQALDRNKIDTTDINVVMPAVDYYMKHGCPDEKMKSLYYLGRIQENKGETQEAIVSYIKAEEVSADAVDDRLKGLVDFGLVDLYTNAHYLDSAMAYAERGRDKFISAGDSLNYGIALGKIATILSSQHSWAEADSFYRKCIDVLENDTSYVTTYLSLYAVMKVVQPEQDPEGALRLLERRTNEYGKGLSLRDYGVYAYASAMTGDNKTCDRILSMLEEQPYGRRVIARYQEYRIAEFRKEYEKANELLKATYRDQDTIVDGILRTSVVQAIQDYYKDKAVDARHEQERQRQSWTLALLSVIIVSGIMFFHLRTKSRKEKEAVDNMIRTAEEANRLLKLSNDNLGTEVSRLQDCFVGFYHKQLERIGFLCEAFLKAQEDPERKRVESVYRRVEDIVRSINEDEDSYIAFESQVDRYFENVVSLLKSDLEKERKLSPLSTRFICYTIAGFDARTISVLLGISLSNVYARRTRLKKRIRDLESPYKALYSKYLLLEA